MGEIDFKKEVDIGITQITRNFKMRDTINGNYRCPYCHGKLRFTMFSEYFCPKCLRVIK